MKNIMFENTYLDMRNNQTKLTDSEIEYFQSVVDGFSPVMKNMLGCVIHITYRDHDSMGKQHSEALGIFYTGDTKNLLEDCFITIDNYFIHECYEAAFGSGVNFVQSLEEVIAHEIAHALSFRHGKKHRKLTADILEQYNEVKSR